MGDSPLSAYFLVGPTATGKSVVAHAIARAKGWRILSADSMLVYTGMDVGTAKPDRQTRSEVRYDGLDLVSPGERFSAGCFRRVALDALKRNRADGCPTIVVGGTGLYVKSLTHGLAPGGPRDGVEWAAREVSVTCDGAGAAREDMAQRSAAAMVAVRDPLNPRRVLRALERAEAGEEPPTHWLGKPASGGPLVGLWVELLELRRRIAARVDAMFSRGLLDEVRSLLAAGSLSATASQAIGYAEAIACLSERCTQAEARERIVQRTCQLAKRQRTWFRHQSPAEWVDVTQMSVGEAAERVSDLWRQHGPTGIACD